jgi:hypothetical protein
MSCRSKQERGLTPAEVPGPRFRLLPDLRNGSTALAWMSSSPGTVRSCDRLHEGDRGRLAGGSRSPRAGRGLHQCSDYGGA